MRITMTVNELAKVIEDQATTRWGYSRAPVSKRHTERLVLTSTSQELELEFTLERVIKPGVGQ